MWWKIRLETGHNTVFWVRRTGLDCRISILKLRKNRFELRRTTRRRTCLCKENTVFSWTSWSVRQLRLNSLLKLSTRSASEQTETADHSWSYQKPQQMACSNRATTDSLPWAWPSWTSLGIQLKWSPSPSWPWAATWTPETFSTWTETAPPSLSVLAKCNRRMVW